MFFPWNKYEELPLSRRNTLQIFITNRCNLKCTGCFARNVIKENSADMSVYEYMEVVNDFVHKGGQQINLLGGEPLLHPNIKEFIAINNERNIKTTVYTNGYFLDREVDAKLRVSIYSLKEGYKTAQALPLTNNRFDANFMVSRTTTLSELLNTSGYVEFKHGCKVFFISSIRELDNDRKEFFDDTERTMPVLKYKELVHRFLSMYSGNMDIHVSKRGVFESTTTLPDTKCRFANYFIGGKIIQCPYDVVNLKYQDDYSFGVRNCQQNNTCLMSKVIYRPKKRSTKND